MPRYRILYHLGQGRPAITEDVVTAGRKEAIDHANQNRHDPKGRFTINGKVVRCADIKDVNVQYRGH